MLIVVSSLVLFLHSPVSLPWPASASTRPLSHATSKSFAWSETVWLHTTAAQSAPLDSVADPSLLCCIVTVPSPGHRWRDAPGGGEQRRRWDALPRTAGGDGSGEVLPQRERHGFVVQPRRGRGEGHWRNGFHEDSLLSLAVVDICQLRTCARSATSTHTSSELLCLLLSRWRAALNLFACPRKSQLVLFNFTSFISFLKQTLARLSRVITRQVASSKFEFERILSDL